MSKRGKDHFAICPFHKVEGLPENTPSLSIDTAGNQYHCFSCNAGGDPIKFVMDMDNLTFPQAVEKLLALSPEPNLTERSAAGREHNNKHAQGSSLTAQSCLSEDERQAIMREVVQRCTEALRNSREARQYLETRALDPLALLDKFTIGFWPPGLFKDLAADEKKKLAALGLATNGSSLFDNCIVFPLYKDGRITTMYGRNITADSSAPTGRHYMLPGTREGLYLPKAPLDPRQPVIITESIIDALSSFAAGCTNVLPLLGVNGFLPDHLAYLKQQSFPQVFVALNGDQAGNRAAAQLQQNLKASGIACKIIELPPQKDVNDMHREAGPVKLREWFAEQTGEKQTGTDEKPTVWEDEQGTYILLGTREYRVRGLSPHGMDRLKVNLRAQNVQNRSAFYVDTLDLYQGRAREHFIAQVAKALEMKPEELASDMNRLITTLEELRLIMKSPEDRSKQYEMTEQERTEAIEYLKAPHLLDRIAADIEACGFVGNRNNALLAYLGALSRLSERPLGILIVARSSAGKSVLQELVASCTPDESALRMTRLTGQSLFYQGKEGLKHKLLTIEEDEGMRDALYAIRVLLSSQKLCVHSLKTDTKTGEYKVYENVVHGPASVMIATTDPAAFDAETASRFFVLYLDESSEQTKAILQFQDRMAGPERIKLRLTRERITKLHCNIQRLLRPLPVINRNGVAVKFPEDVLTTRREKAKLYALIETVALLHQHQRELKEERFYGVGMQYIEVTKEDIDTVLAIGKDMLRHSIDELPKLCRELLGYIHSLVTIRLHDAQVAQEGIEYWQVSFTRKELMDRTRWSRWHLEEHLKELEEAGYIVRRMGKKGQKYAYSLVEDSIPELPEVNA